MTTESSRSVLHGVGDYSRFAFTAMGAPCEVIFAARSHAAAEAFRESAMAWLTRFESDFSFYRDDSLVSRVNRNAGGEGVDMGATGAELVALCDWFHWLSEGHFDPTSAPLLRLWDYHYPNAPLPSPTDVAVAKALVGWSRVERDGGHVRLPAPGMAMDFGGIGKEYAVDKVVAMAMDQGIPDVLVNFGHDVRAVGRPPQGGAWRVGLEDPRQPERCWCGLELNSGSVCTSGDYMRFRMVDGKRYGHIIDPQSGYPVANECLSVTVVAPSCTEAGILSTTAFIMGVDQGMELLTRHFGAEGAIWTASGVTQTPGLGRFVAGEGERERAWS